MPHEITQEQIEKLTVVFADSYMGIATAQGVARVTFVDMVFNIEPGATMPQPRPVFTLAIPEVSLLALAQDIVARHELAQAETGVPN